MKTDQSGKEKKEKKIFLPIRPRRNRRTASIREMIKETVLVPSDLIMPLFVIEGENKKEPVASMPGQFRYSLDNLIAVVIQAKELGIPAVALFPALADEKKDAYATESANPNGLLQNTIKKIKDKVPDITVITDVAMDPYSSHGHDGIVENGKIVNDRTLEILGNMSISQAEAGSDMVAPSDMMDGRIGYIRERLDQEGFTDIGILAYSAKYASSFYGPFRDALNSAPKKDADVPGDKKSYQMDPANSDEALREVLLDIDEGADMVMVKPALPYLDIIARLKPQINVPLAAYNVSGEYTMIKAAAERGWLDNDSAMMETLLCIKRAGADIILSYFSLEAARFLNK